MPLLNARITELADGASPARNDQLPAVDVSDTSMAITGTTKAWTRDIWNGWVTQSIAASGAANQDADVIFVDTSGGDVTVDLPSPNGRLRPLRVKNISSSSNQAFLNPGTDTINGSTTDYELTDGDSVVLAPRTTTAWETFK